MSHRKHTECGQALSVSVVRENVVTARDGGIFSRTATKGIIRVRNGSNVSGEQSGQCFPAELTC